MTIPSVAERPLKVFQISNLTSPGENVTSQWSTGPDFPADFGVVAEDGNVGAIENLQTEPLRIILLETRPANWAGEMQVATPHD